MNKKIHLYFEGFLFLLKFVLVIITKENNKRNLNEYFSEIHLVIQGGGNQLLLNNDFDTDPSEVIINGIKNDNCKRTCDFGEGKQNIILRFDNQITSCKNMFKGLTNIIEIDLSNFDVSEVIDMSFMFHSCSTLKKINFGNINTSSLKNMESLFQSCSSLTSVDISNIDTSKVTTILRMFEFCKNLETINFGNINTSSVENMRSVFNSCNNLKYLDLSNFDTTKVTDFTRMFFDCAKLIFLNINSFKLWNMKANDGIFTSISSKVKYCINDTYSKNLLKLTSECDDICFKENINIDINNKKCIESCKDINFIYEYNRICYEDCPEDTYPFSSNNIRNEENEMKCFDKTPEGYYFDENIKKL